MLFGKNQKDTDDRKISYDHLDRRTKSLTEQDIGNYEDFVPFKMKHLLPYAKEYTFDFP